jgi:hypothetical protein
MADPGNPIQALTNAGRLLGQLKRGNRGGGGNQATRQIEVLVETPLQKIQDAVNDQDWVHAKGFLEALNNSLEDREKELEGQAARNPNVLRDASALIDQLRRALAGLRGGDYDFADGTSDDEEL